MAKVVLTLEDKAGEDGSPGLVIGVDSDNSDEELENSIAANYAGMFMEYIQTQGKSSKVLKDDDDIKEEPPKGSLQH